jgi:hypothetical protein
MAAEPQQSALDELAGRRFSLYPTIRGIEHNEWTLERDTWSEILIKNETSGQELWIPRNHLGEISSSDSPVLILGLKRELEFKAGSVVAYRKVVVSMPETPAVRHARDEQKAPPEPPRSELVSGTDAKTFRLLAIALSIGLTIALVGFVGVVVGFHNPLEYFFRPDTTTADQRYLTLASGDNYHDIVAKMAKPEKEQWISSEEDELQFQALWYGSRAYIVVLMGGSRADMRYIGTIHDPSRRVLDSATQVGGGDTAPLMRNLPKF